MMTEEQLLKRGVTRARRRARYHDSGPNLRDLWHAERELRYYLKEGTTARPLACVPMRKVWRWGS
jgi:hypothetical protein